MSAVTLQLDEAVDASAPGVVAYRLAFAVVAAVGIDPNLFVARVADDVVVYPAAPRDLVVYPADKAVAIAQGLDFYRVKTYALAYDTLTEAQDAAAEIAATVAATNRAWGAGNPGQGFGGRQLLAYDSATP